MTSMIDIMNHVTTDHLSLRVNDSFWQCLMDVFGEKIPEQPHTYNTQTKVHIYCKLGTICMEYQVNLVPYFFFIISFDYIIIFFASTLFVDC